ncbi:MAG: hypothetical protein V1854_04970 [Methanobacteriota archaeon]
MGGIALTAFGFSELINNKDKKVGSIIVRDEALYKYLRAYIYPPALEIVRLSESWWLDRGTQSEAACGVRHWRIAFVSFPGFVQAHDLQGGGVDVWRNCLVLINFSIAKLKPKSI